MKQEEIANQAEQYATSKLIDTSNYSLNTRRKLQDYDNYDLEQAFADGAEWRIKSVWHDASETPEFSRSILLEKPRCLDFFCYFPPNVFQCTWEEKVALSKIKRWAYASDLLPQEKGEVK